MHSISLVLRLENKEGQFESMKTTDHPGWDGTEEGGSNERLLLLGEQIKLDCYWAIGDGRREAAKDLETMLDFR